MPALRGGNVSSNALSLYEARMRRWGVGTNYFDQMISIRTIMTQWRL